MAGHLIVCSLMLVLSSFWNGQALAIRIEINPDSYKITTEEVHISCMPEKETNVIKKIAIIEIVKDNKAIVAISKGYNLSVTNNDARFKAEGEIVNDINQSYLNLTLTTLHGKDSGKYTCIMYYLNEVNLLEVERSSKNLTGKVSVEESLYYLKEQIVGCKKQVADLNKKDSYVTAFSVTNHQQLKVYDGTTLILPDVIMQLGDGYDVNTGVFTAPRPGLYAFNLAVGAVGAGTHFRMYIKTSNKYLAKLYAFDSQDYDNSFVATVVSLQPGQKVMIEVETAGGTQKLNNNFYTFFTGYLVQQYY